MSWSLFWICCWCILPNDGRTERNFEIALDEISVTNLDPELMENLEFQLTQINNRSYIDAQMTLKHNLKEWNVRNTLEFWKPNKQKIKVYDVQFEGCSILEAGTKSRLLKIFAKGIRKHSNLSCPFQADFNYTLNKLFFDEQDFPPFVPIAPFLCLLEFSTKQRLSARLTIHGKTTAKP
ncbi:uncharacterized protein LOC111080542 [Drosophila obscura]|uniref:uncharacterized protein LOC111080542 n=1 Tax=Drosophila obscura TaxID=7282 RepID=UPI001BB0FC7C|nr:uncharacterized protein LOC111080542 [Drosophila obscura]